MINAWKYLKRITISLCRIIKNNDLMIKFICLCFMYLVFHAFNTAIVLFVTILLYLLDTVLLVDETHLRHSLQNFFPEFFVAPDSYMFLILLHFIGACTIGGIALIGTGMMLVAYVIHACGMFRIARWKNKYINKLLL